MRVNLKSKTTTSNKTDKLDKPTIHIVHIVDRSISMSGTKLLNAVKGVNAEIEELQKDSSANYLFTLVHFGSGITRSYWQTPINNVPKINISDYGMTALYQTIGETLSDYDTDDSVLVKIFTDGAENCSRGKFRDVSILKSLIQEKENGNFTITFVGTASDVESIQCELNIAEGNTLIHDNTGAGVEKSFKKSMKATLSYSRSVSQGEFTKTMSFYAD